MHYEVGLYFNNIRPPDIPAGGLYVLLRILHYSVFRFFAIYLRVH